MKLYESSTSILDSQINELFSKKKDSEMDVILKTLSLIVYQNSVNTDLVELYRVLDLENFVKVISLFDGKTIKLPSSSDFKECLILSLIYFYREIKHKSWDEIKKKFPFEISGISYGLKIRQLNNFISQKMYEMLKKIDTEENNGEK